MTKRWLGSCSKKGVQKFILILAVVLQFIGRSWAAKLPPLTAKDISLMLRSGYSSQAVERETAARHVIGPIDPATEKVLLQAGATTEFVANLRSGTYSVLPEELAAAEKEVALREQRRAAQWENDRKHNSLYQSQLVQAGAAPKAAAKSGGSGRFASAIQGNLVTVKNGVLQTFNNQALEKKKFIALYFGARWCPSCRKFTPQLVEFYNRVAPAHPEFEVVFVSGDRSASAMQAYMNDTQMPWPAVAFENLEQNDTLRKYAGPGIPCLVLLDDDGKVLSDSYNGKTYLGPSKVLADLTRILGGENAGPQVAQEN